MAKFSDKQGISNEEIEALVEEFGRKLEILRVRYEQYFIGVEKCAPTVMRMEVARIMRDLEQAKIKNTALKFKLRTAVQKFTSYSTYWNRTLREIEDGTYKRHVDKAKREQMQKSQHEPERRVAADGKAAQAETSKVSEASAAAADFLASMGLSVPKPVAAQAKPVGENASADAGMAQARVSSQNLLRQRRPAIVSASKSSVSPTVQPPVPHSSPTVQPSAAQVSAHHAPVAQRAVVGRERAVVPGGVGRGTKPVVQPPVSRNGIPGIQKPREPGLPSLPKLGNGLPGLHKPGLPTLPTKDKT